MINEMKKLLEMTDEDVLAIINAIHLLTKNTIVKRDGILGLGFKESFRKYGSAYIEFLMVSEDNVTDGYFTTESKCHIVFRHTSIWFAEYGCDDDASNYNKNHFYGYQKLIELGYEMPDKPQWV